jgi:hypothetical protein
MTADRGRAALEKLVGLILPNLAAYVVWEYQVIAATPGPPVVLDLLPTGTSNPFGPLSSVTLWPGPDGGVAVPTPGKLVRLRFANGDKTKPEVCGLDPTDTPTVVYQYGALVQIGTAGAAPLATGPSYTAMLTALVGGLNGVPAGPVSGAEINAIGAAITSALVGIPPVTTNTEAS